MERTKLDRFKRSELREPQEGGRAILLMKRSFGRWLNATERYDWFIALFVLRAAPDCCPRFWRRIARAVLFGIPGTVCCRGGRSPLSLPNNLGLPACGNSVENFDRFCPMCGAEALRAYQITAAKLTTADAHLDITSTEITRSLLPHCGVLLDRKEYRDRGEGPAFAQGYGAGKQRTEAKRIQPRKKASPHAVNAQRPTLNAQCSHAHEELGARLIVINEW